MTNGEIAISIVTIAAGLAGLFAAVLLCYAAVTSSKYARFAGGFGRREDYPMDRGIHKAQMGVPRVKEARPK